VASGVGVRRAITQNKQATTSTVFILFERQSKLSSVSMLQNFYGRNLQVFVIS